MEGMLWLLHDVCSLSHVLELEGGAIFIVAWVGAYPGLLHALYWFLVVFCFSKLIVCVCFFACHKPINYTIKIKIIVYILIRRKVFS